MLPTVLALCLYNKLFFSENFFFAVYFLWYYFSFQMIDHETIQELLGFYINCTSPLLFSTVLICLGVVVPFSFCRFIILTSLQYFHKW